MYKGKVLDLIREKSSRNGNPKYTFVIQLVDGSVMTVTTATDSSLGYAATNYRNKIVGFETKVVRNVLTISSIWEIKENSHIKANFDQLQINKPSEWPVKIKLSSEFGETNFLSITQNQAKQIQAILSLSE